MTLDEIYKVVLDSEKKFYCYVLRRENKKPFYIGVGTRPKRIREHEYEYNAWIKGTLHQADRVNYHKLRIIHLLKEIGHDVDYDIMGFFDGFEELMETEVELIEFVGRIANGGPLCNMTNGGEGCMGRTNSDKQKEAARSANLGRVRTEEEIRKSVETRKAVGWVKSFLGKAHTEEWRKNMSERMSGENHPHYGKRGKLAPNFGKKRSEEQVIKIKQNAKKGQDELVKDPVRNALYMASKIVGCNKKNPLESLLSFTDSLRQGKPKTSSAKLKQYLQNEEYKLSFIKTLEEFINSLNNEE